MSESPFHERQRKKSGQARHIGLISEGGSCIYQSPGPTCIDSIQVGQACTTDSHHMIYRSTTGAYSLFSQPDTTLFSAPLQLSSHLDKGELPPLVRNRFLQQGIALTEEARLEVRHLGRIWIIRDRESRYSIRRLPARLIVYRDSGFTDDAG